MIGGAEKHPVVLHVFQVSTICHPYMSFPPLGSTPPVMRERESVGETGLRRLLLCVVVVASMGEVGGGEESRWELWREDFPSNFVFGAGTSAYQVEGAAAEDGRTPSVFDTFALAGRAYGKSTGDIASDEYHKYKEDVKLMKETGLEGYRFSISWSRLIPNGRGDVNPKGLEYYNNLINELINHGIEPHVTLFHYDLPQVLEDEYGGWLSAKVVDDFTAYANVCFREFGDRVLHWTTLNEPNVLIWGGYDKGFCPPGRCSAPFGNCTHGNSVLEPYTALHNILLAHSSTVSLYRRIYQAKQNGSIGLNIFIYNMMPVTDSTKDILAARRAQDFYVGCFLEPIIHGDYPKTVRQAASSKVTTFLEEQAEQLRHSFDFIGLNYYGTAFIKDQPSDKPENQRDFVGDTQAELTVSEESRTSYQNITLGDGLQAVLEYIKQVYGNFPTYIHENGYLLPHDGTLNDTSRVKYLTLNLRSLHEALRNGSNTLGYFVWSFLDLFELFTGYESSYGLYFVDFADKNRRRCPKLSALWYSNLLKGKRSAKHCDYITTDPSVPISAF